MKKKLEFIAKRRLLLVEKAAQQREALAKNIQPLHNSLSWTDRGLTALRYAKQHPVLIMGVVSLLAMLRPTRAVKWLRRSWVATLVMRGFKAWLTKH